MSAAVVLSAAQPSSPGGRWAARVPAPSRDVVARAQGGDPAAFAALYARFHAPIWNHLYRLFGDARDADEFAQDTFLKAYRALPATSADLHVGPWLYRIATNVALDAFRHRALVRWVPLDRAFGGFATALGRGRSGWGGEGVDREAGGDGPAVPRHGHKLIDQDRRVDPEQAAADADLAARVWAVLVRLHPRYRACLAMREYQGLSYDEIATTLRTTRPAVKSLLFRARAEFRRHWEVDGGPGAAVEGAPG